MLSSYDIDVNNGLVDSIIQMDYTQPNQEEPNMPTPDGRLVVAILTRVSSMGQVKEGHSLETQYLDAAKKARVKFGEDCLLRPYADEGLSGTLATDDMVGSSEKTRPGLSRLLADALDGVLDGAVFPSVDRVARRESVYHNAVEKLSRMGVRFYFADSDLDPGEPEGAMVLGIQQSVAANFSRTHRRRIARAYKERRADGYPPGGLPPYGWRWERPEERHGKRRGYVPDEEQSVWVRFMYDKYMGAAWTTTQVMVELNRLGVKRDRGGQHWDSNRVRKVLTNPLHCGWVRDKDEDPPFRPGAHWEHRFWEPEDRERILQRMRRNRELGGLVVGVRGEGWPLRGIIRCGHCGRRLSGMHPTGSQRAYLCAHRAKADGSRCTGVSKTAEVVEPIVLDEIRRLAGSEEMQVLASAEVEKQLSADDEALGAQARSLERQLEDARKRRDRLFNALGDAVITEADFAGQKRRLDGEEAEATKGLEATRQKLAERNARRLEMDRVRTALADFDGVWDVLSSAEQKEFLLSVVEELSLSRSDDGTGDVLLRLKLHFMPAQECRLPDLTKRPKATGIEGLSPRELLYLAHRLDGRTDEEIATMLEVVLGTVKATAKVIRARTGMRDIMQVAELARDRIDQVRQGLPLKRRRRSHPGQSGWKWTERRVTILERLDGGTPRRIIAQELGIGRKTVDTHLDHMRKQAGVKTWQELLQYAREHGLLPA